MKSYDYEQDFHFHHKMKCKVADKTLEQCFLMEFKATCKNSAEFELKQRKQNKKRCEMHLGWLYSEPASIEGLNNL